MSAVTLRTPRRTEIDPVFRSLRLRGSEHYLDRIADRLEKDAVLRRNCTCKDGEVALVRHQYRRGLALPALGAALDVGEEATGFQPEDVLRQAQVQDAALSPDGSMLVYSRRVIADNAYRTHLWIVS